MDQPSHATTKLMVPKSVRPMVARPRLHDRLDGRDYRVGVVSAPAGFGKTALLSSWAHSRNDAAAWMSCNPSDSQPERFWGGLLAAVGAKWPGVGDDAATMLKRGTFGSDDLAIVLANDLGEAAVPMSIVIDDFHLAPRTPDAYASLISMLPSNVQLVLGTRVDPPLPLGRLRVAGSLLELHTDDLSFSAEETAAAVELSGVATDRANIDRIHDLTEGWPAGVQLATLAMRSASDHAAFLDAFAATDRAVAEFLVDEVLNSQEPDLVEFVYATSVLDVFDADLSEEVTGRADARLLLDQVVAANLFVVRLGAGSGWYRYHHLFRAFLRTRLRAMGLARWRETHARAAAALEARGDTAGALHLAVAGGDDEQPAAIVRRTIARWINVVDAEVTRGVVRAWLERYGRALVVTDPDQVLEFLLAIVATTNPDDSVWWFQQIEEAHPHPPPTTLALLQGVWAEHHLARGQPEQALPRVRQALEAVDGAPPLGLLSVLGTVLVRCGVQADDDAIAVESLAAATRPTGHPVVDNVRIPALRAWIDLLHGDVRRAEQRARAVIAASDELRLDPGDIGRIYGGVTIAHAHLERHEDGDAREWLDRLRHDAAVGHRPPLESLVALNTAIFARTIGDEEAAAAGLSLARQFLPVASPAVRATFDVEAALQAVQFRPSAAPGLIDALGDHRRAPFLRARLALATGDVRSAAAIVADLPPGRTARDRIARNSVIALTTIDRNIEAANAAFTAALLEAQAAGLVRSVLDVAPDMPRLLAAVTATATLEPYIDQLISAATSVPAGVRPATLTSLVEQLSAREVTVLRYLCSRLTYQEIASALDVSLNTLKSHVKSVYRKLGVASRHDAVVSGRQLRIV